MALKGKNRKGIVFMGLGLLMMGAALSLTGYNLWDERRAEEESNQVLEQLYLADEALAEPRTAGGRLEDITGSAENVPDYVLNPDMPMPAVTVDGRQYIGVLTVPSLSLSLPVMSEWSYDNLKIAPCRYQGSAYKGDLIVAGHNYRKHFSPLKTLPIGAEIQFTDVDGNQFLYQVADLEVLDKMDVEEMETGDWDLTLFTCTYGGQTRFTVRCEEAR